LNVTACDKRQRKEFKQSNPFSAALFRKDEERLRGECILCNEIKDIHNQRLKLCKKCFLWCREWVIKNNNGKFSRLKMTEAIIAFKEPLTCKYCGAKFPRINKQGLIRKLMICPDKCLKIWKDGYDRGISKHKTGRTLFRFDRE
jgi:Pyruvate/2-oxoacid:ferredoxin oxidoreductase delta subunit